MISGDLNVSYWERKDLLNFLLFKLHLFLDLLFVP